MIASSLPCILLFSVLLGILLTLVSGGEETLILHAPPTITLNDFWLVASSWQEVGRGVPLILLSFALKAQICSNMMDTSEMDLSMM